MTVSGEFGSFHPFLLLINRPAGNIDLENRGRRLAGGESNDWKNLAFADVYVFAYTRRLWIGILL